MNVRLLSTIRPDGTVALHLAECPVAAPDAGELLIRMDAAPVNPSDMGVLLALADAETARTEGTGAGRRLVADLPACRMGSLAARLDQPLTAGNEGAGTVIDAGPDVRHLVGRSVSMFGGAMYARYRAIAAKKVLILPEGTDAVDAAGLCINPLTALAMVETMREEGHRALVHTAAASNLGQILNRLCIADGVDLVNVVRSAAQVKLLQDQGARHVIDSSRESFMPELTDALAETGATIAFDAVGGGRLANRILQAMEGAALRTDAGFSRYGSGTHKQIYLHGALDASATLLDRGFGLAWGIGGFQLTTALRKLGRERMSAMQQRVVAEMSTTFASRYGRMIGLSDMLEPDVIRAIARTATGEKFLLRPCS